MNRARKELDRIRDQAWGDLAGDVRTTGKRLVRVGAACTRKHPVIILGGGALLVAIAVWRLNRPPGPPKHRGITSRLLRMGRFGLAFALSLASNRAENGRH